MASLGLDRAAGPVLPRVARMLARLTLDSAESGAVRVYTVAVMRWVAVVGQLFTVLFVHFSLAIPLPLAALLPAIGLTAAVNLALVVAVGGRARLSERASASLFAWDVVQLGWLLAWTGGLQNPFALLLLLPVTLAAATLGLTATTVVTGLALIGTALLAVLPGALPWRDGGLTLPPLLVLAAWTALSMALILIASFTWSIAEEVRRHALALAEAQLALERERQLSALGGQAAAAAHLLGSPLGTITVIAKEILRELPKDSPLHEEAADLLAQARRCGEILATLADPQPPLDDTTFAALPLSVQLEAIAAEVARPEIEVAIKVELAAGTVEPQLRLSPEVRHALTNLIDNAIEFASARVDIAVRAGRQGTSVAIEDDGPGFSPDIQDWLGEPYISTRTGQGGMGLGIFIARTLLARTMAELTLGNGSRGARVVVMWPPGALERLSEENGDGGRGDRADGDDGVR
jgi:two-component system sensor histidine kinase RegB